MTEYIWLGIVLFATTNIDDIFVLVGFMAIPSYRFRDIVIGQVAGMLVLVGMSIIASLASLVVKPAYVGLLGFLPIIIGIKKLIEIGPRGTDDDAPVDRSGRSGIWAVAAVTIANGADNIGVYIPVFAASSTARLSVILAVFAAMLVVWIAAARWLVEHPTLGAPIRTYGRYVTPFVLMAIGFFVLWESGSFDLFVPARPLALSNPS